MKKFSKDLGGVSITSSYREIVIFSKPQVVTLWSHGKTRYIYDVPRHPKEAYQIRTEAVLFDWVIAWLFCDLYLPPPLEAPPGVEPKSETLLHIYMT